MRGPGVNQPTRQRTIATAAALVAGLVLSGCIGFDGPVKGKQISAKKVAISFRTCTGDTPPSCSDSKLSEVQKDAAEREAAKGVPGLGFRALIALRTPPGTGVPDQFAAKGEFADPENTFTYNAPYTDALNAAAPRPGGSRYTGYTSPGAFTKDGKARGVDSIPFRLVLRLPDEVGSQFKYRPVLGFTTQDDPTVPLDCGHGSELYDGFDINDPFDITTCIDAPDTHEETSHSLKIPLD
jgi:hypothetical protein